MSATPRYSCHWHWRLGPGSTPLIVTPCLPNSKPSQNAEAVRVAVGLRLGLDLCSPHKIVVVQWLMLEAFIALFAWMTVGKTIRHHSLNDLIARSFSAAGVPVAKEPTGLSRSNGKRPDGLSLVPWPNGKALCWDVTVICPLADSYISAPNSLHPAKNWKMVAVYLLSLPSRTNLGVPSASTRQLLSDLGRRLTDISLESRETSYLFQRCSVLVQRFNAVLLHDSLPDRDCT